jgi:MFS family permease
MSVFFSAASMAGAFSGLLAFAIQKMHGIGNLAGWRWIFILEGVVTVVVGFAVPWMLPDSPESAGWLTPEEKRFIRYRLERDFGTEDGRVETLDEFNIKYLVAALMDWKIWLTVFVYWGNTYETTPELSSILQVYHLLILKSAEFPSTLSPSLLQRSSKILDTPPLKLNFSPFQCILLV